VHAQNEDTVGNMQAENLVAVDIIKIPTANTCLYELYGRLLNKESSATYPSADRKTPPGVKSS
jgi:hypothetical protein